jgi:hypothetical protein
MVDTVPSLCQDSGFQEVLEWWRESSKESWPRWTKRRTKKHANGMVNVTMIKNETITVVNDKIEQITMMGVLHGTICNNVGELIMTTTLQNVTVMLNGKFNLFSLTKPQRDGWLLHGDEKSIWMTKNDKRILFDIAIRTTDGMLYDKWTKPERVRNFSNVLIAAIGS